MNELDHDIRAALDEVVAQAPPPLSVAAIRQRAGAPASAARPGVPEAADRRRTGSWMALAACLVLLVAVAGVALVVRARGGGPTEAMTAAQIERAITRPPGEPAFVETVDWPHHLADLDNGWELLAVEERRPEPSETTNQTFADGDRILHLEIHPSTGGRSADEGKISVGGHPYLDTSLAEIDSTDGFTAWWEWAQANISIIGSGVGSGAGPGVLEQLQARNGDPLLGFDPGESDLELISEQLAGDGSQRPAVVRAWYGVETTTGDGVRAETMLEVQAVAADGGPSDLRTVAIHGIGAAIEEIGGREALVGTFGDWTTVVWYDDSGVLVSASAKNLPVGDDVALARIVESVEPVDQAGWERALADLSERIATHPVVAEASVGDVTVTAREGTIDLNGDPLSHLCITPPGGVETCRGNVGLRDSGPYLRTSFGTVGWTGFTVGIARAGVVVDGVWWVVAFGEDSQFNDGLSAVTVETGAESFPMAASADRQFFVAALGPDSSRAELVDNVELADPDRPSSSSHEPGA